MLGASSSVLDPFHVYGQMIYLILSIAEPTDVHRKADRPGTSQFTDNRHRISSHLPLEKLRK